MTQALILDRNALNTNLAQMEQCRDAGLKLRPYGKTHNCTTIAREQIVWVRWALCGTSREPIVFADSGLPGLLVTTPIVQPYHVARLAAAHV